MNRIEESPKQLTGTNETIYKQNEDSRSLYQMLQKYTGNKGSRNRRALLPFIGKSSKHLFGTMDEEEG
jgi:hypothetical protein